MNYVEETLQAIDEEGIEYCILRNYEFLDGGDIDGDIDLIVRPSDRDALDNVLNAYGFQLDGSGSTRHSSYRRYDRERREVIIFDIAWNGPGYNGLPLVDPDRVIKNRVRYGYGWIPSKEDYFVELVFHSIFNKNQFKYKYQQHLQTLRERVNRTEVIDHAQTVFADLGVSAVRSVLNGNFELALSMKWRLLSSGLRKRPSFGPVLFWNLVIYHQIILPLRLFNRYHNPLTTAPVIALVGPDGSGKTTVSRKICNILRSNDIAADTFRLGVYNNQTRLTQRLNHVFDALKDTPMTTDDAAREAEKMSLPKRKPVWKAVIHFIDIFFRYVIAQWKAQDLIVADRYFHDLMIHDHVGFLRKLIPIFETDPFYGFVLTADPTVISTRSEYDNESVEEMLIRLEDVEFEQIDVSQDVEDVVDDVLEAVLNEGEFLRYYK